MHSSLTPLLAKAVLSDHLRRAQAHRPSSSPRRRVPAGQSDADARPPAREARDVSHSGVAAVIGGTAWIFFALLAVIRPTGCVGPEACAVTPMRDTADLDIFLLAGAALIPGALLAMARSYRIAGWPARLWHIGATAASAATVVAVLGMVAATSWEPAWFSIVVPGLITLVLALAVTGIGIARSGVFPVPVGVLIFVSALLLVGANDQDARVLLWIPIGAAAVLIGAIALRRADRNRAVALA